MVFPNYPNKYNEKTMVQAKDFWKYKKELGVFPDIEPPKGVIICYSPTILNYIVEHYSLTQVDNVHANNFYLLNDSDKKIAICGTIGVGAPVVGILLEELHAFGTNFFISIGTAGSLQKNLKLGSHIICDRAIRDEGTSHHYASSEKYSYPSKTLTDKMIEVANQMDVNYHTGTSWTTDAPYRETLTELKHYRNEGVMTVEMEASAIFAIAKYLNIEAGVILTISDYLTEERWELHFHLTKQHLHTLFMLAKETLNSLLF
ncbi:MAG: nucleoside phosphorylase [Candidatus Lokiarchaeota archaeon]|nr:nucleoside phosphorylase [Candidatus Lokiarchaeota archaeon]